ncbi:MAG TPA: hypothetical protein VLJ62_09235, partial [Burkholderiaceae bacterium]|nr:hypothetical protein [Burkholderiaceae bacterium]
MRGPNATPGSLSVQDTSPLIAWLDHLQILMPPRHVLMVGAGNGASSWVQWLARSDALCATLVEADDGQVARLQQVCEARPQWRVRKQVVGTVAEATTFHVASMASESGLLEPEGLRSLWPNLRTRHKQTRQAIALAELLEAEDATVNWLVLDCLPGLPLLQSIEPQLAHVDVLLVRAMLEGAPGPLTGMDERSIESWLHGEGFRRIATEPGRHPAVGHVLLVRDPAVGQASPAQLVAMREHADSLTRELEDAAGRESAAVVERQALLARVAELTHARTSLAEITARREADAGRIAQLESEQVVAQAQIAELIERRDRQKKAASELVSESARQAAELQQARAALEQQAGLHSALEQQAKAAEHASQVHQQASAQTQARLLMLEAERVREATLTAQLQAELTAANDKLMANTQEALRLKRAVAEAAAPAYEAQAELDRQIAARHSAEQLGAKAAQAVERLQREARELHLVAEQLTAERNRQHDEIVQLQHAAIDGEREFSALKAQHDMLSQIAAGALPNDGPAAEGALPLPLQRREAVERVKAVVADLLAERERSAALERQLRQARADAQAQAEEGQRAHGQAQDAERVLQEKAQEFERALQAAQADRLAWEAQRKIQEESSAAPLPEPERPSEPEVAPSLQLELHEVQQRLAQLLDDNQATRRAVDEMRTDVQQQSASVARLAGDLPARMGALSDKALPALDKSVQALSAQTALQTTEAETRLRNEMRKQLAGAVKQVESFMSIQNYLASGEMLTNFHGWPISPDVGVFVLEKIRERKYDLIIEFGSGTSTMLFAKA